MNSPSRHGGHEPPCYLCNTFYHPVHTEDTVCPPTDTFCASIHSGGLDVPSPGRARIVSAKEKMKCFALCYLSNTLCYPFTIWRGMMSLRAADRRQKRPKMKNQQISPATDTFCYLIPKWADRTSQINNHHSKIPNRPVPQFHPKSKIKNQKSKI